MVQARQSELDASNRFTKTTRAVEFVNLFYKLAEYLFIL